MKNKGIIGIMLTIMTIFLCSCGGEYATKESVENVASGSAVSESSIRETTIKEKTKEEEQAESFTTMLYLHNSQNAYRVYDESVSEIQQLTLTGEVIRTIVVPESWNSDDPLKIAKVTEDELFYVVSKEKGEDTWTEELWSIPLIQENGADTPQVAQAKKIFEAEEDSIDILYADSRYISYGETEYKEYDRKEGKFIEVDCEAEEKDYYCLASTYWGEWHGENNLSTVLLFREIDDDLFPLGIFAHQVGSGKVTKITKHYPTRYYGLSIASSEDKIYYTGTNKTWEDKTRSYDIWCYDCKTGKASVLIKEKQLKKATGIREIQDLYINNGELWIAYGVNDCFWKYPLTGEGKLQEVKEVNKYVKKLQDKYEDYWVLRIHDNLCFYDLTISEDDDEIEYEYGCYDFVQKEEIKINQKELEKTSGDWFTRRELPY